MTDHTEKRCRDCDGYNCDNGCAYPPKDTEMQIPDGVMEAATRSLGEWTIDDGSHYQFHMCATSVARAILAERTRFQEKYDALVKKYGHMEF